MNICIHLICIHPIHVFIKMFIFGGHSMKSKHTFLYKLAYLILSLSLILTSCSKTDAIITINNTKLTIEDFLYDIYLVKLERDKWNESYKEVLGIDYWDYEFDGVNMEMLAKDTIMTRVILYDVLSNQAKEEGISLSNEEVDVIESDVDKLIQSITEARLNDSGLNREILINTLTKLTLGDKYYQAVISDFEVDEAAIGNSLDPSEFREYKTECLYVPTTSISNQELINLCEDELSEAYNKIINIRNLTLKDLTFEEILNEIDGVTYYERDFIYSDNTAEDEYKDVAMSLENGEYSDIVTSKFGHYIIHMLDNNSSGRFIKAIDNAILDEKKEEFYIYYDELLKDYEILIDKELWETIDIRSKIN